MTNFTHGAPDFTLSRLDGLPWEYPLEARDRSLLLVFFETDCPTCRLTLPYLNRLEEALGDSVLIVAISQNSPGATQEVIQQLGLRFTVLIDGDLSVSELFDPVAVPTLYLLDERGTIGLTITGFSKTELNEVAAELAQQAGVEPPVIADPFDGSPESKPGCMSRHREPKTDLENRCSDKLHRDPGPASEPGRAG